MVEINNKIEQHLLLKNFIAFKVNINLTPETVDPLELGLLWRGEHVVGDPLRCNLSKPGDFGLSLCGGAGRGGGEVASVSSLGRTDSYIGSEVPLTTSRNGGGGGGPVGSGRDGALRHFVVDVLDKSRLLGGALFPDLSLSA